MGLMDLIGNDTSFGQKINQYGNMYQSLTNQPQSQLIGQPNQQMVAPPAPTKSDVLKNYLQSQNSGIQTPDISQPIPVQKGIIQKIF